MVLGVKSDIKPGVQERKQEQITDLERGKGHHRAKMSMEGGEGMQPSPRGGGAE